MAIETYPVSPVAPSFTAVNFKVNTPTLITRTTSGMTRRIGQGHSYYSFTVQHKNLTRFEAGPVLGFVAQQFGPMDPFNIILPELSYSKTTNQTRTTVTTSAAAAVGATSVAITGVAIGKELLRAGDFFQFANHTKVYMCTSTWDGLSPGNPLEFSGGLVQAVPSGTAINYGGTEPIRFRVILENEVQQWDTGVGGIVNISLDMREVWGPDQTLV